MDHLSSTKHIVIPAMSFITIASILNCTEMENKTARYIFHSILSVQQKSNKAFNRCILGKWNSITIQNKSDSYGCFFLFCLVATPNKFHLNQNPNEISSTAPPYVTNKQTNIGIRLYEYALINRERDYPSTDNHASNLVIILHGLNSLLFVFSCRCNGSIKRFVFLIQAISFTSVVSCIVELLVCLCFFF